MVTLLLKYLFTKNLGKVLWQGVVCLINYKPQVLHS